MNTLVLHGPPDISDVRRWGLAAALVVATHVALVAGFVLYTPSMPDAIGTASEPIMLDLESAPQTPEPVQQDIAPGPQMQEAEPPAPEPEKQPDIVEEQITPTPLQEKAEILAPPEKPKPKPEPVKQKPKKPTENPAPQTTATPRAAQAARASYNGMLSAHLQRYKQYPSGAKAAGEQGVAMLSFTVNRNGSVTGARLSKSSGSSALDGETMAMIHRAQPLPSFPAEMTQSSASFTVPVRFFIR
ncbi:energy transducer TonB [Afipia massiliensis]|uniref:Energy transducer TonB n=1 Tax=Afipia massiliensis TaxID=211460 RepID=A0A4U6BMB1_9BRAD|nr:energy transducer TonB [Afipia massiliensis]TKT71001.1 energy transducer TonB [Afipia massiliensis]